MGVKYLNPVQEADIAPARLAPRLKSINGMTLGLLSNGKINAEKLLIMIAEELAKTGGPIAVVEKSKSNAGRNCPPELIDELVETCDAVITGLGD